MTIEKHTNAETITSVRIGEVKQIPGSDLLSGINKSEYNAPLFLTKEGLKGDHQADRRFHGGPEKALHFYHRGHYAYWRKVVKSPNPIEVGSFGENITCTQFHERNVRVGDIFRLGDTVIQVSQGRQPCFKLNAKFQVPDMSVKVQQSGRTGWYCRVLEEGEVKPNDTLTLLEPNSSGLTLAKINFIIFSPSLDPQLLSAVAETDSLSESWRRLARLRLESGKVENWDKRLFG
ncbi:MOSC domain-containing protein [Aestuariibacter sp. AA17]|uniref:MOSC domain-containing protein n=1 Tax=Fluctibacter corallii TaxID=2984329 RepID=A0ABT3A8G7_9ALTE|nr:MOSC domain-containing protein [Aestuariibacter sp. AA17]MCV2884611.1 MOSC domain-containing protein [Aestuariibacter sp. AA17]